MSIMSRNLSGKIFQKSFWVITRKSSISISILNHVFWKRFPRILLCHDPKYLKWHLEIFSRKPPDSPPGFFDVINFELKYLKKVIYEVCCDIISRCTNPPPSDATWLVSIIDRPWWRQNFPENPLTHDPIICQYGLSYPDGCFLLFEDMDHIIWCLKP